MFNGFYLTYKGQEYIAKSLTGKTLAITRGQFGKGSIGSGIPNERTSLVSALGDLIISKKAVSENRLTITTQFSNKVDGEILPAFYLTEAGIYGKVLNADGTTDSPEILIAYAYSEQSESDYIQQVLTEFVLNWPMVISAEANVEVTIDESLAYPTLEEFNLVEERTDVIGKLTGNGIVAATDVSPVEHEPIVKVYGKNFFDVSKITNTEIATNNGDGSLTIAANNYYCRLNQKLREVCPQLKAGDVVVLSFETGSNAIRYMYFHGLQATWNVGHYITMTEAILDSYITVYGYPDNDANYGQENVISNIQIELGKVVTDYEPYIDPSTVTVGKCGKNLIGLKYVLNGNGSSSVISDQTLAITGYFSSISTYKLKIGERYTLSFISSRTGEKGGGVSVEFYDENENRIQGIYKQDELSATVSFTVPANTNQVRFYFYGSGSTANTTDSATYRDIQLEAGGTKTDFEPYNDEEYTPASDGTVEGFTPYSPNMTIYTNTKGLIIECEYVKDRPIAKMAGMINSGLQKVLLWENADTGSSFSSQKIRLDLADYDSIEVEYIAVSSTEQYVYAETKEVIKNRLCHLFTVANHLSSAELLVLRTRSVEVHDDGVVFRGGYDKWVDEIETTHNDRTNVPVKIYGIKGVQ